jgi:2-succinyl-6-hydroxy-2,4-cyclohexadiene-1-carboxylate synthase
VAGDHWVSEAAMSGGCVVMLHGFGGTGRAFDGVIDALPAKRYTPIALDLPGHGSSSRLDGPITYERCVQTVLQAAPERFVLCGYSMGGRIALRTALAAPQRVSRLVLVSATAGIEDEAQRLRRAKADEALAAQIEREPMQSFVQRWRSQPMFADEPEHVRLLASADHRRNTTTGLAAALRGIGQGAMWPLWERLHELEMPITVLAGERDRKYQELGRRIAQAAPDASLRILAGGHGLVLENPSAVAEAIDSQRLDAKPRGRGR